MSDRTDELLLARGIGKTFPGVKALDKVDLTLRAGEIHALMGENGAGKSTLIKILTGVYARDVGTIEFDGRQISPNSPSEAEAAGISTVYQEVNLIPTLSVAENILLGRQPKKFGIIQWRAMRRHAARALERLGLELEVSRELRSCSIAIQQMIAIARALDVQAKLLILDEPTSSLDEQECEALFAVMRRLRDDGLAIAFVTHFLDQVYAVTDRITVLRNGGLVGEFETAKLPKLELIAKMLGKESGELPSSVGGAGTPLPASEGHPKGGLGETRPTFESASAIGDSEAPTTISKKTPFLSAKSIGRKMGVEPLDLQINAGEVLGLAGLLGSGRTETARLLFGIDSRDSGHVSVEGKPVPLRSPREAISRGLAFCSEDRKTEGIAPNLSVRENLILAMQASRGALRQLPLPEQLRIADHYIRALNIKTADTETPIRNLSGGNQQKVLLARWLAMQPKLIILDEPTRGIDVGAKAEIEKLVESLRERGMAVLFISSELDEVVRVSQRVVVLRDRRKVGELEGDFDEHRIMNLIAQPHE
ncbi:ATP-binding cassette domain-containing protein [bacterium]|nr:ATP-binding cassette domain-containing protein [bacterium]